MNIFVATDNNMYRVITHSSTASASMSKNLKNSIAFRIAIPTECSFLPDTSINGGSLSAYNFDIVNIFNLRVEHHNHVRGDVQKTDSFPAAATWAIDLLPIGNRTFMTSFSLQNDPIGNWFFDWIQILGSVEFGSRYQG